MRRPLLALTVITVALIVAACSSSSAPAWTYAPPTASPSAGASAGASGAPSAAPSDSGSAAPSGGAGGDVVEISAQNVAYQQTEASAPADKPFAIHFVNNDASIPHNVAIKDASGMEMFKGEIITGPNQATYSVPALAAGTYQFTCTVHPNMVGTLKVGG